MAGKGINLGLNRGLLRAGERVCVAVSGGADSVALLLGLMEANTASAQNKEPLGVVLSVAHVHHGLRGEEADADAAFVRELCGRVGVPYKQLAVDVVSRRALEREGLEEAARELRYAALLGLEVDAVATGHTLDDQAETVMMKLLRGAWTEGLGGISPMVTESLVETHVPKSGHGAPSSAAVRVVRPLLGVRRAEVEEFLRSRGQVWREDATNQDVNLTRNRVRHELMPMLRRFNPGVDEVLARLAAIARDDEAFWQMELARVLPQMLLPGAPVRGGGRAVSTASGAAAWAVEITRLATMPVALRRRVVRAVARSCGARLSAEETAKVLALAGLSEKTGHTAKVSGRSGSRLELAGGLRVERSARELRFWREG